MVAAKDGLDPRGQLAWISNSSTTEEKPAQIYHKRVAKATSIADDYLNLELCKKETFD